MTPFRAVPAAGVILCFVGVVALALSGCSERLSTPTNDHVTGSFPDNYIVNPQAYPAYCFVLNLPWMSQLPPGTNWSLTRNCGQACCAMLGGYFNNGSTQPWVIDAENNFLHYPKPYGDYTSPSTLQYLLREFHALQSNYYIGNGPDDVVAEGARGRPVIVGVRTRMQETGGVPHWMLFLGWDGTYMYFHDPGRSRAEDGRFVRYTVEQFRRSWTNQGKKYIPVYRG